ncbi:putative NAD(P)/FAD-binding protein YdhS [Paraburkholderia sp. BL18I3N2]|uniref:FAD/NAD(P)-binding protein n=1 Tax=Paraburkholderia sp. BL18I3N2 TaxID=1938799 RepID=UPI000D057086|nr:FAD/NAD(P)-binding protein [Paraburkholderia sp. BL18I3N2]PRX27338.1 putative NAD(P)/FAD-binding protein YdhS [Paraburkholderia sp. BL18I3N2]
MKTIVIIGAGFSGTVLAAHLLTLPRVEPLQVLLLNRSGAQGRGVAYGTRSAKHILNVPAGNMSAISTNPGHFLDYCRQVDALVRPESFVSRRMYGEYLEWLLAGAASRSESTASLARLEAEVICIQQTHASGPDRRLSIKLSNGETILADETVLAVGNFPPCNPPVADASFYSSSRYVGDPWAPGTLDVIPPQADVLLLGTGLTAVDVAAQLAQAGPRRQCYAVSRRGLLPHPHRTARGPTNAGDPRDLVDSMGSDVRSYVRVLREHIRVCTEDGLNWRDVLASLRQDTPELWRRLNRQEQRRFLRHIQSYWDVHRHRLAPEADLYLHGLLTSGLLQLIRGRVTSYQESLNHVDICIQLRGGTHVRNVRVGYVINCTGPATDLRRIDDRLISQLLKDGLISPDMLGLGLRTSDAYECLDAKGESFTGLRYIGPLLKARYWEATAVPELRVHAEALARLLLKDRLV